MNFFETETETNPASLMGLGRFRESRRCLVENDHLDNTVLQQSVPGRHIQFSNQISSSKDFITGIGLKITQLGDLWHLRKHKCSSDKNKQTKQK